MDGPTATGDGDVLPDSGSRDESPSREWREEDVAILMEVGEEGDAVLGSVTDIP